MLTVIQRAGGFEELRTWGDVLGAASGPLLGPTGEVESFLTLTYLDPYVEQGI